MEKIEVENNKIKDFLYDFFTRVFDVIVSSIGIIIFIPLFVVLIIVMKIIEPNGTVFFSHTRNGKNGKKFKMYKFRTMVVDAENKLKENKELYCKYISNGYKLQEGEDPRINKLGGFLRKTSIDELPQLINVLIGHMSIVGPRPIPDIEIEEYGNLKNKFLSVKPGITGWWQVSGRSNVGYPERKYLELEYIDKKSFSFDIKILFLTIISVVTRKGAI